jgi:Fe-S-cluster-containing hydrogenase component 2
MKKIEKDNSKCIACRLCEQACNEENFSGTDKKVIMIKEEQQQNEIYVCNQCGECISVCPVEAIYRDSEGVVRIEESKCVACLMCVGFCPENAMFYNERELVPYKCISCGACVAVCPTEAIEMRV